MGNDVVIGAVLFCLGAVLLFIAMPKGGVSPKFVQFHAAPVVVAPIILALLVLGAAEMLSAFYELK